MRGKERFSAPEKSRPRSKRFSAGHQRRRLRRDGHHSTLPSFFEATKGLHKFRAVSQLMYEMSSYPTS
jgi:hypothetical protein